MEFNKNWIDAVNYRTSRRAYMNKQLEIKDINKIKELIYKINEETGLNFQFI